jgi:hypothetical protein
MIKSPRARCQWFTLVILATKEAEIRRIMVQGQPGQIVHTIPSQPIAGDSGAPVIPGMMRSVK